LHTECGQHFGNGYEVCTQNPASHVSVVHGFMSSQFATSVQGWPLLLPVLPPLLLELPLPGPASAELPSLPPAPALWLAAVL
jgi:hypothetical protein